MKKLGSLFLLVLMCLVLVGCGKTQNTENKEVSTVNDNKSYFFKVNGKKFSAGDTIKSITKTGYDLRETEKNEEVPANKYMIGAGRLVNSDSKLAFSVTPYNPTSENVKIIDSQIGGFKLDNYYVKYDENIKNIEVVGGLKLGSTLEQVEKVFGEASSVNEYSSYTTYKYESDEIYRYYSFDIDKDGKVVLISWKNLVYNK